MMAKSAAGELLIGAKESASDALRAIGGGLAFIGKQGAATARGLSGIATVLNPILTMVGLLFAPILFVLKSLQSITVIAAGLLSIIRSLISLIGTLLTVLKALAQLVFTIFRALGAALVALFRTVGDTIGKLVGGVNSHLGTILKVALGVTAAIAAAFIGTALAAERAWQPLAQTIGRLRIAGVAQAAIAGLRDVARDIRRATLTASAEVVSLAEKAAQLGVPQAQLKATAAAAVGLGQALGMDAATALGKIVDAMKGDFDGLKNLIPALKGVTDQKARLAVVSRVAQQGLDLAGQSANTVSGLWTAFKNVLAENAAVLGEKIQPGITKIVTALRPLLGLLESSGESFARVFNGMADLIEPVVTRLVRWFAVAYAAFFAFGKTVTSNWRTTWELVKVSLEYYLTVIVASTKHFFTSTLPAVFNWFVDWAKAWAAKLGEGLRGAFDALFTNLAAVAEVGWDGFKDKFSQLFYDLLKIAGTGLGSLAAAFAKWLTNPAGAAGSAIASGAAQAMESQINAINTSDWKSKLKKAWSESLTEGFDANVPMPALPNLPKRKQSFAETGLGLQMKELFASISKEFGINFDQYLAGFNAILDGTAMKNAKDAAGGISAIDKSKAKGDGGSGNTLLESRFMSGATGQNPLEQKLDRSNTLAEQRLEEQRKNNITNNNLLIRMNDLMRRMDGFGLLGVGG